MGGLRIGAMAVLALSAVGLAHGLGSVCTFINPKPLAAWGLPANWDCTGKVKTKVPTSGDTALLTKIGSKTAIVDASATDVVITSLKIEGNASLVLAKPFCQNAPANWFNTTTFMISSGVLEVRSCTHFVFSVGTVSSAHKLTPGVITLNAQGGAPASFGGTWDKPAVSLTLTGSNTKLLMGKLTGSTIQYIQNVYLKKTQMTDQIVVFQAGNVQSVNNFQIQGTMSGTWVNVTTFSMVGYLTIQSNAQTGVTFLYSSLNANLLSSPTPKLTLYTDNDEAALNLGGASSGVRVPWINAQLAKKQGTTLVKNQCGLTPDKCTVNGPYVHANTMKITGSPYKTTGGSGSNGVGFQAKLTLQTLSTDYAAKATHSVPSISFPSCSSISSGISSTPGFNLTVDVLNFPWCSQMTGTLTNTAPASALSGPVSLTVRGNWRVLGNIKSTGTLIANGINSHPTLQLGGTSHSFDHIYVMNATVFLQRSVNTFQVNELWMGAPGKDPINGETTLPTLTGDPSLTFATYTVNKFGFGFPQRVKAGISAVIRATLGMRLKTTTIVVQEKVHATLTISLVNPTGGGSIPEVTFTTLLLPLSGTGSLIMGIDGKVPKSATAPRHIKCLAGMSGPNGYGYAGGFGLENVTLTAGSNVLTMKRGASMFMGPGAVLGTTTNPMTLLLLGDNLLQFNKPSAEIAKMNVQIRGGSSYLFSYKGKETMAIGSLSTQPHIRATKPCRVNLGTNGESWTIGDLTSVGVGELIIANSPAITLATPNTLTLLNMNTKTGKKDTDSVFFMGTEVKDDKPTNLKLPSTLFGNVIVSKSSVTFASGTVTLNADGANDVAHLWFQQTTVPGTTAEAPFTFVVPNKRASVGLDYDTLNSAGTTKSYVIQPTAGSSVYIWGRDKKEGITCQNPTIKKGTYTINAANIPSNGFFSSSTAFAQPPNCEPSGTPQPKKVAPMPTAAPTFLPWPTVGPHTPEFPPMPFMHPFPPPVPLSPGPVPFPVPVPQAAPVPKAPPVPVPPMAPVPKAAPVPVAPMAPVPKTVPVPQGSAPKQAPKAAADSGGIGSGGVAGIIIGVLAFLAIGAGAAYYLIVFRKRSMYKDIE